MKFKLKAFSIWEFGQRKDANGQPHQEDSLYPLPVDFNDNDRLFILCDGMGGHDAGEVASSTVCQALAKSINSECPDPQGSFTRENFIDAMDAAYEALDAKDTGSEKKMGTTMTMLKLFEGGAFVAHIGDSRVYHIRPGKTGKDTKILFQTEDHSLINELVKMGEMTREEAKKSGQKNVITRAMQPGPENRCKANVMWITDIQPGDYFYLCSDGMLEQDEMENGEALKNIFSKAIKMDDEKVAILKGATEENRDNHTAIIVHILDVKQDKRKVGKEKNVSGNAVADAEESRLPVNLAIVEESRQEKQARVRGTIGKWLLRGFIAMVLLAAVAAVVWLFFWLYKCKWF